MTDDRRYDPGTSYRIDERTGFKTRNYRMRKEWSGRYVREQSYEERHPQDQVRGTYDEQTVSDPRPRSTDVFVGPLKTTLITTAIAGATTITVFTVERMDNLDVINIMLDNGEVYRGTIQSVMDANRLLITPPLPYSAQVGRILSNTSANSRVSF